MSKVGYVTTSDITWIDADERQPPAGMTVLALSKYGVATKGPFTAGFHVAWIPLPKIQPELRAKLYASNCQIGKED